MERKELLVTVVDGQGGGIGRQYIESLRKALPKDLPVIVRALGTNSAATSNMVRSGATDGATGENAIIKNVAKADIIVGVVAIVVPGSILGELTAKMATAIGESDATRILIPFDSCNTKIAMLSTGTLQMFIDKAVQMTIQRIIELS